MPQPKINRRDFLKKSISGTAMAGILPLLIQSCYGPYNLSKKYNSKGIPTRILGKTGISVPIIGIGGGSRFCRMTDVEASTKFLNTAIDHGLYYFDTAHDYGDKDVISEERFGLVVKHRRKEIFLATKVGERTYDGAMRHLEESLTRLHTDHLDLYQIHNLKSLEEVDRIGKKDGALQALQKLRDQKITHYIGFTGHTSVEVMEKCIQQYDFDTMLIALNHHTDGKQDFENKVIPLADSKNLGIMVIKVIRPRETVKEVSPSQLIRYALGLSHVSSAVIGMDNLDILQKNIQIAKTFKPMNTQEMENMSDLLMPFFDAHNLPWMQPGYIDGQLT